MEKRHSHHSVAKSRGGTDEPWNLNDLTTYEHAYGHAIDFVLFENAPAFDFRLEGWNQLPEDLKEAVRKEKARRTALHNQTLEMRTLTSERNLVDNPMWREDVREKVFTEERNEKISNSLTGIPKTVEHRNNLSGEHNGMFGRNGELNPFYGKTHSTETKAKMREAKKGKPWSEARRKAFENSKKNEHQSL